MELWTAFILGLLGSVHCAGMCGPLALALPASGNTRGSFLTGRLAYNVGRTLTYGLLGGILGTLGQALSHAQEWISIAAGLGLLLSLVLSTSGTSGGARFLSRLKGWMSPLLRQRTMASALSLGLLNGLLPCGLVYAACAGAISRGDWIQGIAYMGLFGLGTFPMMLGIGIMGPSLLRRFPIRLPRLASVCTALMGALLLLRGMGLGIPYLSPDLSKGSNACSLCHPPIASDLETPPSSTH